MYKLTVRKTTESQYKTTEVFDRLDEAEEKLISDVEEKEGKKFASKERLEFVTSLGDMPIIVERGDFKYAINLWTKTW